MCLTIHAIVRERQVTTEWWVWVWIENYGLLPFCFPSCCTSDETKVCQHHVQPTLQRPYKSSHFVPVLVFEPPLSLPVSFLVAGATLTVFKASSSIESRSPSFGSPEALLSSFPILVVASSNAESSIESRSISPSAILLDTSRNLARFLAGRFKRPMTLRTALWVMVFPTLYDYAKSRCSGA